MEKLKKINHRPWGIQPKPAPEPAPKPAPEPAPKPAPEPAPEPTRTRRP